MTEEQIKSWCLHHYCRYCEYNVGGKCMIKRESELNFRNHKVSYDFEWLDDNTFVFQFGDGELKDNEDLDYFIHFEYHADEDKWIIEIFWDSDSEPIGFSGSEEYINKKEIEEIKEFAKKFMR